MTTHMITISLDGPAKLRLEHERIAEDGTREKPKDPGQRITVDRGDKVIWKSEVDDLKVRFAKGANTNPFDPIEDSDATFNARKGSTTPPGVVSVNARNPHPFKCFVTLGTRKEMPDQVGVETSGS